MDIPVISIIDDDDFVREAVKDFVRSLGYAAPERASAEDYLRSNEYGTSSCLIIDSQMPGISGADLQAQLSAEGTPIIFMTAFDNEKIRARVLKAGAFGYLKKPFDDSALVRCLEKALKLPFAIVLPKRKWIATEIRYEDRRLQTLDFHQRQEDEYLAGERVLGCLA